MLVVKYAIICDDIRKEDTGKLILIGVYSRDIRVAAFPATLVLSLCVGIESDEPKESDIYLQCMIGDNIKFNAEIRVEVQEAGSGVMTLPPFVLNNITEGGIIVFKFKIDEADWQTVASIPILLLPSVASSPPA